MLFFLFAHIYLPHIPFVFNKQGFYWNEKPFLQNDENYTSQLDYCDVLLGQFLESLKKAGKFDSSEIIILSDHNYRLEFPGRESKIPMFIKHPYQRNRKDIFEEIHAERLLKEVLLEMK